MSELFRTITGADWARAIAAARARRAARGERPLAVAIAREIAARKGGKA